MLGRRLGNNCKKWSAASGLNAEATPALVATLLLAPPTTPHTGCSWPSGDRHPECHPSTTLAHAPPALPLPPGPVGRDPAKSEHEILQLNEMQRQHRQHAAAGCRNMPAASHGGQHGGGTCCRARFRAAASSFCLAALTARRASCSVPLLGANNACIVHPLTALSCVSMSLLASRHSSTSIDPHAHVHATADQMHTCKSLTSRRRSSSVRLGLLARHSRPRTTM